MPVCDGNTCSANIPWRITTRSLQLSSQNVKFNWHGVRKALVQVLTHEYGGTRVSPPQREPVFKSLCWTCWRRQAGAWGDVGTYAPARARTTSKGCFFQVADVAFIVNRRPITERILSCVVHELMHYWSFNYTGLQKYNRTLNVDWDEAVADLLGYLTFRAYYRGTLGTYYTPYNRYPKCMDGVRSQVTKMPPYKWTKITQPGDVRNALPVELRKFIEELTEQGVSEWVMRRAVARRLQELVFEGLATWFFSGPSTIVKSIGESTRGKCDGFLTNRNGGLGQLITLSGAFPAYGGGADAAHSV